MSKMGLGRFSLNLASFGMSSLSLGLGIFPIVPCVSMIGISTLLLYQEFFNADRKLQQVFRTFLVSEKENKMPTLVKIEQKENGFIAYYKMNINTTSDDFIKRQKQIEEHTRTKVDIFYDKGLLKIKAYTNELKTKYPFKVEQNDKEDSIFIGYDLDGAVFISLNTFCHILFGGTTGWGKSTTLNSILTMMLLTKDYDFYLVDHKKTELSKFEKCNKVKCYTRNNEQTEKMLREIIKEMDKRNDILGNCYLSDIGEFNEKYGEKQGKFKRSVIIIDEFAMLSKEVHGMVQHILNTGRSAGFHLIICTLRPSKDVICGDMKNNMACRISLKLITDTDSQVILDCNGAEEIKYIGRFILKSDRLRECQGMFIDSKTIKKVLKHTFENKTYNDTKKKKGDSIWS